MSSDEKLFSLLSKCFDEKAELNFMFNAYGAEVNRRNYFTLDSYFYSHEVGSIFCRFTVMDNKNYQLVYIYPSMTSRPGLTVIPKEIYVRDNYYELMRNQRLEKAHEKKAKLKIKK